MKKYIHFVLVLTIAFGAFLAVAPQRTFAQETKGGTVVVPGTGSQSGQKQPSSSTGKIGIISPLKAPDGLWGLAKKIFETLLTIMLPFVSIALLYSGFLYLKAQGNPTAIAQAHQALMWSLVGTALVLGAWTFSTAIYETIKEILK